MFGLVIVIRFCIDLGALGLVIILCTTFGWTAWFGVGARVGARAGAGAGAIAHNELTEGTLYN